MLSKIYLSPAAHSLAKRKAAELGLSMGEWVAAAVAAYARADAEVVAAAQRLARLHDDFFQAAARERASGPYTDANGIEWRPMPPMPRPVTSIAKWRCWVDTHINENRNREINGESWRWIIPTTPPPGLPEVD